MEKIKICIFQKKLKNKNLLNLITRLYSNKFDVTLVLGSKNRISIPKKIKVKYLYSEDNDTTTYRLSLYLKVLNPDILYSEELISNFMLLRAKKMSASNAITIVRERKLKVNHLKEKLKLFYKYNFLVNTILVSNQDEKENLIKYHIRKKKIRIIKKKDSEKDYADIFLKAYKPIRKKEATKDIDWEYYNQENVQYLIDNGGKIGNGCKIYPSVHFGSEPFLIKIGNNVRITDWVKFLTHDGGIWTLRKNYKELENAYKYGSIEVGDNTHIGWNTIIMPNVKIGKNCIIGCDAVVTKDIPDNSIAVGVPAKVIETIDEYYQKNKDQVLIMTKEEQQDWNEKRNIIKKNIDL